MRRMTRRSAMKLLAGAVPALALSQRLQAQTGSKSKKGLLPARGNHSSNIRFPSGSKTPSLASGRTGGRNPGWSKAIGMPAICTSRAAASTNIKLQLTAIPPRWATRTFAPSGKPLTLTPST